MTAHARTRSVRRLLAPKRIVEGLAWRAREARRRLRRAWYRDRAWIGRLVAVTGNRVAIAGCRFRLDHPLVTDAVRCRMLRGRYERSEREILDAWLDPAGPVLELGGGLGIVATLVNRRLTNPERHVVVEANSSLLELLEHHKQLNAAAFIVRHAAIDYSGRPIISFGVNDDFLAGRVGGGGLEFEVPAITLRGLLDQPWWQRATLICDIEGMETELVEREAETLARHFRTLIVEVHPDLRSAEQRDSMLRRLEQVGFQPVARLRKVHAFVNRRATA